MIIQGAQLFGLMRLRLSCMVDDAVIQLPTSRHLRADPGLPNSVVLSELAGDYITVHIHSIGYTVYTNLSPNNLVYTRAGMF